jgi:hypothetical protein
VDSGGSSVYKEVIGVVAVILNVAFVVWCCYCIVAESRESLAGAFRGMKRWCAKCLSCFCVGSASSSSSGAGDGDHKQGETVPGPSDSASDDTGNQVLKRVSGSSPQVPHLPTV